jgi:TolA-binding protein
MTYLWSSWGVAVASETSGLPDAGMSESERRQKVHELYQKQIPLLEQYAQKYPTGPRAGQTMFRLGEAYFETAKYYQLLGQASRTSLYVQKAVNILEQLRELHPHYDRIDEALLVLASTYLENGDQGKAGPVLAEIADRFPNSPIMDQASFLLGDFYFERGRYPQARQFYEKATLKEKSRAYAHYKLAWVSIKESQPAKALQHFETVIRLAGTGKESFDYTNDAAREIVWPAFEVHRASGVVAYLEKALQNKDLFQKSLEGLATGLEARDEFKLASQIYDELLNRFNGNAKTNDWLMAQLKIEEKLGRSDRVGHLLAKLGQGGARSSEELQAMIYSSAKKFHGMAQQEKEPTRKAQLYDQAIAYYQAFNQVGLAGAKAAEIQFFFGEALYARSRFAEAIKAYQFSAETVNDKQLDALWSWYLTSEKLAPGFRYQGKERQALSSGDENFLIVAKKVAENSSISLDRRRTASYQSARLVYQLNDFDRALPIFKELAEKFPGTKEAELSAQLVLDIYNLRQDYQAVARYARDFQTSASGSVKNEFQSLEQKAAFKAIQDAEVSAKASPESGRASELKAVAARYNDFARQYPGAQLVDAAIWAAIQLYVNAADLQKDAEFGELRASFQTLVREYPNSRFKKEAIRLFGLFLADRQPSESFLSAYRDYRDDWARQMRAEPAADRGALGMIVYKLSSDEQKRALEKEFASLPFSPANRIALAYGKKKELREIKETYDAINLSSLKTLASNTKKKISQLDKLQGSVTKFVELGVADLSVEALELLAQANEQLAFEMRNAPEPKTLVGEDLQTYRTAVNEKAKEFDARAQRTRELKEKARLNPGG